MSHHTKPTHSQRRRELPKDAMQPGGACAHPETVAGTQSIAVRRARASRILDLAGSGLWQGDLAEMREDRPSRERLSLGSVTGGVSD